jgi:hypothetical protein
LQVWRLHSLYCEYVMVPICIRFRFIVIWSKLRLHTAI